MFQIKVSVFEKAVILDHPIFIVWVYLQKMLEVMTLVL